MANQGSIAKLSFLQELMQFGVYKPSQGKIVRQVTFAALGVAILFGCWRLLGFLKTWDFEYAILRYAIPAVMLVIGGWCSLPGRQLSAICGFPHFG